MERVEEVVGELLRVVLVGPHELLGVLVEGGLERLGVGHFVLGPTHLGEEAGELPRELAPGPEGVVSVEFVAKIPAHEVVQEWSCAGQALHGRVHLYLALGWG